MRWQDAVRDGCRQNHFVTTLAGRRRPLPDITSDRSEEMAGAERKAINTVCQVCIWLWRSMCFNHIAPRVSGMQGMFDFGQRTLSCKQQIALVVGYMTS